MKNTVKGNVQDFSKSVSANISRSKFYRPSTHKTTFNAGDLVPLFIDEIYPGDTYQMNIQHVARTLTPIVPVMDNLEFELYAFFVPNRIVYDEWKELMGENVDTAWTQGSAPHGVPAWGIDATTLSPQQAGKIGDYYGIPVGMDPDDHPFSVLPIRGYTSIWNEWYRNQNVQAPLTLYTDNTARAFTSGADYNANLFKANKPFDYFTSCLPEPQKGESQLIPINLNTLIPVITDNTDYVPNTSLALQWRS